MGGGYSVRGSEGYCFESFIKYSSLFDIYDERKNVAKIISIEANLKENRILLCDSVKIPLKPQL